MNPFVDLAFSPEAREMFARAFGISPGDADSLLTEANGVSARRYEDWKRTHPMGSLKEFAKDEIRAILTEMTSEREQA